MSDNIDNTSDNTLIATAVSLASEKWKMAFNSGDASGCADAYEAHAIMQARPMGTFTGQTEIQTFWQTFMDDGYKEVEYKDQIMEVVDSTKAILSADWKMNKASGVIHKELWVLQADGTAKLREDDFEVLNQTE